VANFSRNGFFYTLDRANGQFIRADQFQEKVTWTKGIDPKTGKPVDYDPTKDVQLYAGLGALRNKRGQESCPAWSGAPTFFPPTFDAKRQIAFVAAAEGCTQGYVISKPMDEAKDWVGTRMCCQEVGRQNVHGSLWAVDVRTGKVVTKTTFPIANESGMLSTGGDLLFTGHHTGRFAAYDADTLQEGWSFNLGTPITAPAMSYSVNGKQYIAIIAGGEAGLRGAALYQPSAFVAVFGL
jgi:alcohol dehydrogenase (cytochrome c)